MGPVMPRRRSRLDLTRTVFELIDMRSFSNLWYWIALAVTWSTTSHWIIGVPWDMVQRARRQGGQAEADLEAIVRVNVNRISYIGHVAGLVLAAIVAFLLSSLAILGWVYHIEFCQAVFLIAFPMSIVGLLSLRMARRIGREAPVGEPLRHLLHWHRLRVQIVGVLAIFVTAFWGMLVNMQVNVLGG